MSSDVISLFNLDKDLPFKKFMIATKDSKSDLGFLYMEILGFLLKNNFSLVMVNISQSFNHFCHLLSKIGVQLKTHKENGKVLVVDVLNLLQEIIIDTSTTKIEQLNTLSFIKGKDFCMKELFTLIENNVTALHKKESTSFIIFIDDISFLQNIGVSHKEIYNFVHYCRVICKEKSGFLLLGYELSSFSDSDDFRLISGISHLADLIVHIQGLSTGYSKDVHGKLSCTVKGENIDDKTKVLFKVEERGVKLLPLGL